MTGRVLIVGWDGADWNVLRPMLESDELPHLKALLARAAYGPCLSTVPSHSWSAWPSFMTALNPGGHGVFDILEYKPGAARRRPVTYRSIKARTIFDDVSAAGKTTLAVNIPLTFPAPAIRGKVVAGGVLPANRPFTHPPELQQELEANAPFPINGMSWTTFRNRAEAFLREVAAITERRQTSFEYLLDSTEWDLAVLVYVSPDRIQHCLMEYLSPDHPRYEELKESAVARQARAVYGQLDEGLGRLLERTREDDLVILMSDHGHQPCTRSCTMDRILQNLGYLEFGRGSYAFNLMRWGPGRRLARRVYDLLNLHGKVAIPASPIDWSRTRAYTSVVSTGEGVSVNLKGREEQGVVDRRDFEKVREDVADALASFRDPDTGNTPVAKVYRKEELLSGKFLDIAPDLLLVPATFYSLTHAKAMVEDADWMSGDHRPEGIVAATGRDVGAGALHEPVRLIDLGTTALAALGVPSGMERDGRVVTSFTGANAELTMTSGADGDGARPADRSALTDQEEGELEEHLRGLGYVE